MMEILRGHLADFHPQFWASVVEIIWINILLSGDNALVIALACRALPRRQRLAGMVLGTAAAVVLRLAFASVVVEADGDSRISRSPAAWPSCGSPPSCW